MIKLVSAVLLILSGTVIWAQPYGGDSYEDKVRWTHYAKKIGDNTYELISKARIEEGWKLYGQFFEDGGPVQLNFFYNTEEADYTLNDITYEYPEPKTARDEIFNIDIQYFTGEATFVQRIQTSDNTDFENIRLVIEGQVCRDEDGRCMLTGGEYTFKLK